MRTKLIILCFVLVVYTFLSASDKPFGYSYADDRPPGEDLIHNAMERGVSFIKRNQYESGEFPTYLSSRKNMADSKAVHTIFLTLITSQSLNYLRDYKEVKPMIDKSVDFIMEQMSGDENGTPMWVWNFYGRYPGIFGDIDPDVDDTMYSLIVLKENNVYIPGSVAEYLLTFRNKNNIFPVWFNLSSAKNKVNAGEYRFVDCASNVHAFWYYSMEGRADEIKEVTRYVADAIKSKNYRCSIYYDIYWFSYTFASAYAAGGEELEPYLPLLKEQILDLQKADGGWGSSTDTALALNALLDAGYDGREIREGLNVLLSRQKTDGSWDMSALFHGLKFDYWGSDVATTALGLEALSKYRQRIMAAGIK